MPKAVRFENYGGIDVLKIEDVPRPVPGEGQVLVQVKAAGINPGEAKIREGLMHSRWPATFPSGPGQRPGRGGGRDRPRGDRLFGRG